MASTESNGSTGQVPQRIRGIERVNNEPSFVLKSWPWRETSLTVDVFSRAHGRVKVVAKGAKRPGSKLRVCLLAFQVFSASWSGRSELKTLVRAEWLGGIPPLHGRALLCAFYFNELLVQLLPKEDPHPHLFDDYQYALTQLTVVDFEPLLRWFELRLLHVLGHLPSLDRESSNGQTLLADQHYLVDLDHGVRSSQREGAYLGATLIAIENGDWSQAGTLAQAKRLTRSLLQRLLGDYHLKTRQMFVELNHLG